MATLLHIYSAERDNEVLRRVRLWSDMARPRASAGFSVRVGISRDGSITWFGAFSQVKQSLAARTPLDLTGLADLSFPLQPGDVCVIELEAIGTPAETSVGMCVEWKFARVGGTTQETVSRRMDNEQFPAPHGARPLFSLGRHIPDPVIRQAIEPIEESLNTSGITEWVLSVALPGDRGFEGIEEGAMFDHGVTAVLPAGSNMTKINTTSVTLVVPDPTVPYRLHVAGGASCCPALAPPTAEGYGEFMLYEAISGTVLAPYPTLTGKEGVKTGIATVTAGQSFAAASAVNVGWAIPLGQQTVQIDCYGSAFLVDMEWHDPWISARLLRDPYPV